jgi:hypothetical protein
MSALEKRAMWIPVVMVLSLSLAALLAGACGFPESARTGKDSAQEPSPPDLTPLFPPQIAGFDPPFLAAGDDVVLTLTGRFFTDTRATAQGACKIKGADIRETQVRIAIRAHSTMEKSSCRIRLRNERNRALQAEITVPIQPAAGSQ